MPSQSVPHHSVNSVAKWRDSGSCSVVQSLGPVLATRWDYQEARSTRPVHPPQTSSTHSPQLARLNLPELEIQFVRGSRPAPPGTTHSTRCREDLDSSISSTPPGLHELLSPPV